MSRLRYRTASDSERDQNSSLIHNNLESWFVNERSRSPSQLLIPLATARGSVSSLVDLTDFSFPYRSPRLPLPPTEVLLLTALVIQVASQS